MQDCRLAGKDGIRSCTRAAASASSIKGGSFGSNRAGRGTLVASRLCVHCSRATASAAWCMHCQRYDAFFDTCIHLCPMLQVLDQHAEKVIYETVLVADSLAADTAQPSNTQGCSVSIAGDGLAAASAALSALQTAAATGTAATQLLMTGSDGRSSSGLPGMLKSWAAETGGAVLMEQQQRLHSDTVLQLTAGARTSQPLFAEQESRLVTVCAVSSDAALWLLVSCVCIRQPLQSW